MLARLNLARNRLGMKKKNQPFIFQKDFLAKEKLEPQLPTSATHRWDYGKEDVHSLQQRNTLSHLRHPMSTSWRLQQSSCSSVWERGLQIKTDKAA